MTLDEPVRIFCEKHGLDDPRDQMLVQYVVNGYIYDDIAMLTNYEKPYVSKLIWNIFRKTGKRGTNKNSRYNLMAAVYQIALEQGGKK